MKEAIVALKVCSRRFERARHLACIGKQACEAPFTYVGRNRTWNAISSCNAVGGICNVRDSLDTVIEAFRFAARQRTVSMSGTTYDGTLALHKIVFFVGGSAPTRRAQNAFSLTAALQRNVP